MSRLATPMFSQTHEELSQTVAALEQQLRYLSEINTSDSRRASAHGQRKSDDQLEIEAGRMEAEQKELDDREEIEAAKDRAWQAEMQERTRRLDEERAREAGRREKRRQEQLEWEKREKERELERQILEYERKELERDRERQRQLEAERAHEEQRQLKFVEEIALEKEKQEHARKMMELEKKAVEDRLREIFGAASSPADLELSSVLEQLKQPAVTENVAEERALLHERELQRQQRLKEEREQQRQIEKELENQRQLFRTQEEAAQRHREAVRVGELFTLAMLKQLFVRTRLEEHKLLTPPIVVSSLLRTLSESTDKAVLRLAVHALCRLFHGTANQRQDTVCQAMLESAYGAEPLVRVLNLLYDDITVIRNVQRIVIAGLIYSPTFANRIYALEGLDFATSFTPPPPIMEVASEREYWARVSLVALGTLQSALAGEGPPGLATIRGMELLEMGTRLSNSPSLTPADTELIIALLLKYTSHDYLWLRGLQGLSAIFHLHRQSIYTLLVTPLGVTFLRELVALLYRAAPPLLDAGVKILFMCGAHPLGPDLLLESGALGAFVAAYRKVPELRGPIRSQWAAVRAGMPDLRVHIQFVERAGEFTPELEAALFDMGNSFLLHDDTRQRVADNAVVFLAGSRGVDAVRLALTVEGAEAAVVELLWRIVQVGDALQFAPRLAEELHDQEVLEPLLRLCFRSDLGTLQKTIEVLLFCVVQAPDAEAWVRERIGIFESCYATSVAMAGDVGPIIELYHKLFAHLYHTPPALVPLDEILDFSPVLTEANIQYIQGALRTISNTPEYHAAFRKEATNKILRLFETFSTVPEVLLQCLLSLKRLIQTSDPAEVTELAKEFASHGGITHVMNLAVQYPSTCEAACSVLATFLPLVGQEYATLLRQNAQLLLILYGAKCGTDAAAMFSGVEPADFLTAITASLHSLEETREEDLVEPLDSTRSGVAPPSATHEFTEASQVAAKHLEAICFPLIEGILRRIRPPEDVAQFIADGGVRLLCRVLEGGSGILSADFVMTTLRALVYMIGPDAPDSSPVVSPLATFEEVCTQVAARFDGMALVLAFYRHNRDIVNTCLLLLHRAIRGLPSAESADTLVAGLASHRLVDDLLDYAFTGENLVDCLGLLEWLSVGDLAGRVWKAGGIDIALTAYHLGPGPVQSTALLLMGQLSSNSIVPQRTVVLSLNTLDMARNLLSQTIVTPGYPTSADPEGAGALESWAAMRFVALVALASLDVMESSLGAGIMYTIAKHLTLVDSAQHTIAASRCIATLIQVGLHFKHSSPFFSSASNELVQALSVPALTAAAECFVWRILRYLQKGEGAPELLACAAKLVDIFVDTQSNEVFTRLLACNTRLLLNLLLEHSATPAIARQQSRLALETLNRHALAIGMENVSASPVAVVPLPPRPPFSPKELWPTLNDTGRPGTGSSRMDDEEDEEESAEDRQREEEEDKAYLQALGADRLYEEMMSVLLAHKPDVGSKQAMYDLLQRFVSDKNKGAMAASMS
eukprot:TRINITY_DN12014_c0_g1_i1.p1 TRINITY_DN12014_c0_g1~~TRINITY_DN12014_c0_g1_i1.p1  ORF type:complete len:1520 (+),score=321.54 TRINITY_DN12014_c0_g1_i1:34-4560(+)